jgi:hypothetical protein
MTEQTVEGYNMCQLELCAYRVVLEPTISTSFLTDVELKMGFCVPAVVRWGFIQCPQGRTGEVWPL